ncbi:cupin domain-containing protein [Geomesophilobacter sediminis]|uniref:Cupin domain-containing protein n=1 Tax=Geomesophilobacter sediminis TaxID=2798584 RepID=A0A8J7LVH0_9BACT|nr:cupin domain-containing protein [Geomesophilobacter sediminis]MBJ6725519.1 cupin domain-containing protein [Geomesophilobacter sediminis]
MKGIKSLTASVVLTLAVVAGSSLAVAAAVQHEQRFLNVEDLIWQQAPPALPPGAKVTILYGNPFHRGPFVIRMETTAGYVIPPHYHSMPENLTVLSGTLYIGDGDVVNEAKAHALKAGGYHYLPARSHHYAFSKEPAVVQLHGNGPFDIIYLNPKDDPRKKSMQ